MLKWISVASLSLALLTGVAMANGCSKSMKLSVEQWPPYIYLDQKNQPAGVDAELVKAIFAEARCGITFVAELPKKRRMAFFIDGDIDLLLAASDTPERREYAWFSRPYRSESVSLFARSDKAAKYADISGFADLLTRKITLLSPNAGWYGEDYKNNLANLELANLLSTFDSGVQGMRMFAAKRAELILGDTGAVVYVAQQQGILVTALPLQIANAPVHLMFSKKSITANDVVLINQAIDRLEARGELAKIRARYGLK